MYEGDSWNSSRLNKSKLFEDYPQLMFEVFNVQFKVRKVSSEPSLEQLIVCLNGF